MPAPLLTEGKVALDELVPEDIEGAIAALSRSRGPVVTMGFQAPVRSKS
jgi:hypothetical protein